MAGSPLDVLNRYAPAPAAAPARPGVGQLLFDAPEAAPADPLDVLERYAPAARPGVVESFARGGANALTLGFADEIAGGLEFAFTGKSYKEARDESREAFRRAKDENPLAYGAGQVAGTVGSLLVPGLNVAKGAGAAAVMGRAALQGGLQGLGDSKADLTEGDAGSALADAGTGALVGGAIGGAGALVAKGVKAYVAAAPERAAKQFSLDMTQGANPAFAKRFSKMGALAREVIEPDKALTKAADKSKAEAADLALSRLDDLSEKTAPLWGKVDEAVGKVPVKDYVGYLVKEAKSLPAEAEAVHNLLLRKAQHFAEVAKAQGNEAVPHQVIRRHVTGLLKEADASLGSLSETERFIVKSAVHESADDFLTGRLNAAAKAGMQEGVSELRGLNRQIAAYANAHQLFKHQAELAFRREAGVMGKIDQLASGGGKGMAAGVGAAMSGSLEGAAIGYAVPAGIQLAAKGIKTADRKATAALAKLVEKAKAGDVTSKDRLEAIAAGVPKKAVRAVLGAYRTGLGLAEDDE